MRKLGLTIVSILLAATPLPAEVPPAKELPCFPGAYYRKAVSSEDAWTGLEGIVTLPKPTFDESRRRPKNPAQFLDNPSVYIGGRAGDTEIDAGVTWEVVRQPDGKVSPDRRAFRPFWRNKGWFAGPAHPDHYFYPGDTIRMRIACTAPNKLTLSIELIERGDIGKKATATYGPTTRPVQSLMVNFDAPGFRPGGIQQFKRVNAIDQVGREGKDVDPTRTTVRDATWTEVSLLRGADRLPMTPDRFTDMRCPRPAHHAVTPLSNGGERIDITGTP